MKLRLIAWTLVLSVTCLSFTRSSAHAMLAPVKTEMVLTDVDRQADLQTIQKSLESKALRGRLQALGLSDQEIQSRLTHLSDEQVHQLASQIKALKPAGDGEGLIVGLLVIAVLVLLIVFLAKRI